MVSAAARNPAAAADLITMAHRPENSAAAVVVLDSGVLAALAALVVPVVLVVLREVLAFKWPLFHYRPDGFKRD